MRAWRKPTVQKRLLFGLYGKVRSVENAVLMFNPIKSDVHELSKMLKSWFEPYHQPKGRGNVCCIWKLR